MNSLIEIISVLKPAECRALEKALRAQTQGNKRLELFRIIAQGQLKSDAQLSQAIYGKEPNSAFSHLKSRLYYNILELIFPDNLPQVDGAAEQLRFECGRKILLAQFFIAREAHLNAAKTLAECQDIAVKGHLHAELLIVNDLLLHLHRICPLMEEPVTPTENVNAFVASLGDYLSLKAAALELDQLIEQENLMPAGIPPHLHRLATLPANATALQNPPSRYWTLRLQLHYATVTRDIEGAVLAAKQLQALLGREEFPISEHIMAMIDIVKVQYCAGQEAVARQLVQQGLEKVDPQSILALTLWEQVFLMDMYAADYVAAGRIMEIARGHSKRDMLPFNAAKWQYYEACMDYLEGKFQQSLSRIAENKELFKYKSKWLLGLKLLEIYNFFALGKQDLVEYKLNALKQLLKRQKQFDIRRCKHICKVIVTLSRTGSVTPADRQQGLRMAMQHWNPFNFEVIGLDTWINRQPRIMTVLA